MAVSHNSGLWESLPLTDQWLESSPVPPLEGAEGVAERLTLLAHYGADFDIWGDTRRLPRYWDALAENVKAATYAGRTLTDWWARISTQLPTYPRGRQERVETLLLISSGLDRPAMHILRDHSAALTLRARLVSENRRTPGGESGQQ